MSGKKASYKEFERFLTLVLFLTLAFFVLYLIGAGTAALFLKILGSITSMLLSTFGLWNLLRTKELLRQRSLWLTLSFGAVVLLTIVSLICSYPAP